MATRCCSPPESFVGKKFARWLNPDPLDGGQRTFLPTGLGLLAVDFGQHHVFQHRPVGQQVERLKHEPDASAPQSGPLIVGQLRGIDAVEEIAAAGRMVQAADDVQQRRLSGTRRTGDRQPFATLQPEIDVDERVDGWLAAVSASDLVQLEHSGRRIELVEIHHNWVALPSPFSYPTTTSCPGSSAPSMGSDLNESVGGQTRLNDDRY